MRNTNMILSLRHGLRRATSLVRGRFLAVAIRKINSNLSAYTSCGVRSSLEAVKRHKDM